MSTWWTNQMRTVGHNAMSGGNRGSASRVNQRRRGGSFVFIFSRTAEHQDLDIDLQDLQVWGPYISHGEINKYRTPSIHFNQGCASTSAHVANAIRSYTYRRSPTGSWIRMNHPARRSARTERMEVRLCWAALA